MSTGSNGIMVGDHRDIMEGHLHGIIERNIHEAPSLGQQVAIEYQGRRVRYSELKTTTNRLARIIREHIAKAAENDPQFFKAAPPNVAVFMSTGLERIFVLLALWKLGVAYLPLDPVLPSNILEHALDTTMPMCIIHDERNAVICKKLSFRVPVQHFHVQNLLELQSNKDGCPIKPDEMISNKCPEETVAVIIMTSGSTGKPKAVPLTHRNLLACLQGQHSYFRANKYSKFASLLTFRTVAFPNEFCYPLLHGASQVLINDEMKKHPEELVEFLGRHRVTHVWGVAPQLLQGMYWYLHSSDCHKTLETLEVIGVGAEMVSANLAKNWINCLNNGVRLVNSYAMSETSSVVSFGILGGEKGLSNIVNNTAAFDEVIENTVVYILNEDLACAPTGEMGRIAISGPSVFSGYLGHESNSIITNTICPRPGHDKMFLTSDFGLIRDGKFYFRGREKNMLKVHGMRISTIEIEKAIEECAGVDRAAAFGYDTPNETFVVAYFTVSTRASPDSNNILAHCKQRLPYYMWPRLHSISSLPRLPGGKVDIEALKKRYKERLDIHREKTDSKSGMESRVFHILSELLHVPLSDISADEVLENMGANSMHLYRLWMMLRDYHVRVSFSDFMHTKTVKEVINLVASKGLINAPGEGEAPDHLKVVPLHSQTAARDVIQFLQVSHEEKNPFIRNLVRISGRPYPDPALFWEASVESKLSVVVHDVSSGKLLAAGIIVNGHLDLLRASSSNEAARALFDEAVRPLHADLICPADNVMIMLHMGTSKDLSAEDSDKILKGLVRNPITSAKKSGKIKWIVAITINPVSQQMLKETGFQSISSVRINTFEFHGCRPFSDVPEEFTVTSHKMEIRSDEAFSAHLPRHIHASNGSLLQKAAIQ